MRRLAMAVAPLLGLVALACNAAVSPTAGPSVPSVVELSLPPAAQIAPPPSVGPPAELPPFAPPCGPPPPPPAVIVDYTNEARDLAGFVAAYRETFGVPNLDAAPIDEAGARLCTYLQRHADANGVVVTERAVTEADINEPGYPRDVWVQAYALASAFYCPEFTTDDSEVPE